MAITPSDIETRYSGGATNTDPNLSLGGAMSTQPAGAFASAIKNNLFDDVLAPESLSGESEYRGFYVKNNHGTLVAQNVVVWIDTLTASADTEFDIGLAPQAVNVAMATIANEGAAPASVTFTRPTTRGAGLVIGDIPVGQFKGVWIRRTVNPNASAASDSGSISIGLDTQP